jgi:uncharacterized ubiquitin-like protein YukD
MSRIVPLKELEEDFLKKLNELSPKEKTNVKDHVNELPWRHYWRNHLGTISKIKKGWRRQHLPAPMRWAPMRWGIPLPSEPAPDSDPETWLSNSLGKEDSCHSGALGKYCKNWHKHLFVDLKKYLLQKYVPAMSDADAQRAAIELLEEVAEIARKDRSMYTVEENVLHQIHIMDEQIKNGLLRWFHDRGLLSMYKPNRPYENVANYVVINEYGLSDWDKIYPLLGNTDVDHYTGHSEQLAKLLKILNKMQKPASHHALTVKKSVGGRGRKLKQKSQKSKK